MKNKAILLASCLVLFVSLNSCKENDDNSPKDLEKPTISAAFVNEELITESTEGTLYTDSTNSIELIFSDNVALSQCSINLHYVDGDHGHEESVALRLTADDTPFAYGPVLRDLSGKKDTVQLQIPISNNVLLGEYHLEVLYTDEAANSSETIYLNDLVNK